VRCAGECPQGTGGGLRIVNYPKSKKPRHVSLSPALALALMYHREAQPPSARRQARSGPTIRRSGIWCSVRSPGSRSTPGRTTRRG
jgi:hypothetical protein